MSPRSKSRLEGIAPVFSRMVLKRGAKFFSVGLTEKGHGDLRAHLLEYIWAVDVRICDVE